MLFAAEATPVIEICYDDYFNPNARGMFCPAMYAAMAANLHMPYWVVTGSGGYGSPMRADLPQLRSAAGEALETIASARAARHGADRVGSGVGGEVAGLLRRLKRKCTQQPAHPA